MANLFWPDADDLRLSGYGLVARVPCVFSSTWAYHDAASRYLRERALLEWTPARAGTSGGRRPTRQTLRTYGEAICNFLEWCELRGIDWREVTYLRDILEGYQRDMLEGRWSAYNRGLAPRTVNLRVYEACNFLSWAASRKLRGDFAILVVSRLASAPSARSSLGHRAVALETRVGSARPDPQSLQMPTDQEIRRWLSAIRVERGATKALMCELVIQTGIRREEAVQWRIDTLPEDRGDWLVKGDHVEVVIRHGTKGPKSVDSNGEEVGPPRQIGVPLPLAERLHEYRQVARVAQRAGYVRTAKDDAERRRRMRDKPLQLFLSDHDGRPLSYQSIYEAWTGVSYIPCKGWSPHPGRHYWACKTLMRRMAEEARNQSDADAVLHGEHFRMSAMDIVMLVIRPQLGHVSAETTERYLVWVQRVLTLKSLHDEYEAHLETLVAEESHG